MTTLKNPDSKRCFCFTKTQSAFIPVGHKRKLTKMVISEESKKKHTGGRPKKANGREINKGVRFTKSEYATIKEKAYQAGIKISSYLRQMALNGEIMARLNEEERFFVGQLIRMANNLNQLTKLGQQDGSFTAVMMFEKYRIQVDELLNKIREK